ncbi:MAG: AraC family transcriptional regulator [Myxococcota bacterium]
MSRLERRLTALAGEAEGLVHTSFPGLRFFRTTELGSLTKVEAKMVTLAVIVRGRKHVDFGNVAFTYEPGTFLFITGERRYLSRILEASAETPYLSVALELPPEEVAEVLFALRDAGLEASLDESDADAFVGRNLAPVTSALARLLEALRDPVDTAVLAPLIRREIILHLLKSESGAPLRRAAAGDDGRIRRAMAYIESKLHDRLTVEDVARHVAMSPSHFAHRFRDVVRMSPIQYAKHLRLQRARVLMVGEGFGAAEAASSLGYASPSHFTRDFKGYFGSPPATYVQRFRGAV